MQQTASFLYQLRQNDKLPIRIVSPDYGHLTPTEAANYVIPQHAQHYLLLFMLDGRSRHRVDLQQYEAATDELIFTMPHQVHEQPVFETSADFIKLGFDESCLSLLPKQYPFLINPLNYQKVSFEPAAALRLKAVFAILLDLLKRWQTEPELILAHLNSLLTEINTAYFKAQHTLPDGKLSRFIAFKFLVEHNLTNLPTINAIAQQLGINTNGLYQLVKSHSGLSPKEFINGRLILEARRRICYEERSSVKDLAYGLGFNDPEYFSRLFKKLTGQTIAQFSKDLSGN
ncbi:MAG: helix-turn-helix transcriptional regulator [Terrimonas ferruginea]|uniref:helix-turn-helix domain-containing protein n=1 Tax=Terrimonas ferruginea TaxID=249 RepID=UPI000929E8ED|nr:AraC family transcriptional regulator [Terrimonas ferruginea]MBN8784406.1 helix-turn-helix transcriptional regulator [Terrimonas ferruginea]OJW45831.1 MAG: AraC family transcriptional regulator [Sphingobacteriales bacterium 48-107]